MGPWKAHFFTQTGYGPAKPEPQNPPALYHLGLDPGEKRNVAPEHPEIIDKIRAATKMHQDGVVPGMPQLD